MLLGVNRGPESEQLTALDWRPCSVLQPQGDPNRLIHSQATLGLRHLMPPLCPSPSITNTFPLVSFYSKSIQELWKLEGPTEPESLTYCDLFASRTQNSWRNILRNPCAFFRFTAPNMDRALMSTCLCWARHRGADGRSPLLTGCYWTCSEGSLTTQSHCCC